MASPSQSTDSVFRPIPAPERLNIPAPTASRNLPLQSKPIGTVVQAGDRLAVDQTETDAAPLAPLVGTIGDSQQATLLNGEVVNTIEFLPAESGIIHVQPPPTICAIRPVLRFTDLGKWIDHLLAAGISAFRTGSPDLIGQLYQCMTLPIDTVLCCVLDSDPNLPLNAAVAESYPAELAAGIDLLAKLTGAFRVWVVADPTIPNNWYGSLDPLIIADGLRLVPLRGDYPQPHPTILLHTLLERKLRPGRLPVEQGVLLLDANTAVAIGRCALYETPMLDVHLGVRDHVRRRTHFLNVPVGTRLSDICAAIGVPPHDVLFRGGDFLRHHMLPADAVVGPGELVVHIAAKEISCKPDPCIRCGWCIDACPTRVQPAGLLEAAQRNNRPLGERYGLDACIECGICSFVCPSKLPLLESIRKLKETGAITI